MKGLGSSDSSAQDGDAYAYLGLTYFRQNRLPEAAAALRNAIARNPAGTGFHLGLGLVLVLLQQRDREGVRREFAAELRYHPGNQTARIQAELLDVLPGDSGQ